MTSERQTGEPRKGGDEHDAFSRAARRILGSFKRPGVAKAAKRAFNRRVRRQPVEVADTEVDRRMVWPPA